MSQLIIRLNTKKDYKKIKENKKHLKTNYLLKKNKIEENKRKNESIYNENHL